MPPRWSRRQWRRPTQSLRVGLVHQQLQGPTIDSGGRYKPGYTCTFFRFVDDR